LKRSLAASRAEPSSRSLLSAAGLVLLGNIMSRALGFLFPVLLTHTMARRDYALVSFYLSTGWFASQVVLTGFPTALSRELAAEPRPEARGSWTTSAVLAGIPLVMIATAVGVVLAVAASASPALIAVVIVGLTLDAYYFGLLRGLRRFELLAAYRVLANLSQILVLAVVVQLGAVSTAMAVMIYSLVYLIPMALFEIGPGIMRLLAQGSLRPTRERAWILGRFARASLVTGLAWGVVGGLDIFFVKIFAPEALADYAAARTLAVPMTLVPFAVSVVLLPRVAESDAGGQWTLLRRALTAVVLTAVAAVVAYVVLARRFVSLVLPESYAAAADSVVLLAPATGLLGVYAVLSDWWLGTGRPRWPAIAISCGAAVTVSCQVIFTSAYGTRGAVLSVAAGAATALVVLGRWTLRDRRRRLL
jgi:O-antigen/teichoic acid export membrane protein